MLILMYYPAYNVGIHDYNGSFDLIRKIELACLQLTVVFDEDIIHYAGLYIIHFILFMVFRACFWTDLSMPR